MGNRIYYPYMGSLDKQNALAELRKWTLIQDNSGPHRVYRDKENNVYHSVTHIPVSYTHLTLPTNHPV